MKFYIKKAKEQILNHGYIGAAKIATKKILLLPIFHIIVHFKKNRYSDLPNRNFYLIIDQLEGLNIQVKSFEVKIQEYKTFIQEAYYPPFYIETIERRRKGRFSGKALEHYITNIFLNFKNGDVFVDIAGYTSPYVDIVQRSNKGVKIYSLDFVFKKGIHGRQIGADATKTGLPNDFCNKISLHCAYEMFLGRDDVNLIPELFRILKPGGTAIIIPIYMNQQAIICRSLSASSKEKPVPEGEEIIVWRETGTTFRNYSAQTLKSRVIDMAVKVGFNYEIYSIRNLNDITTQLDSPIFLILNKPK